MCIIGVFITTAVVCNFFVQGCRNVEAGEQVKKLMKSCGIVSGEVTCFQLDVGSFKSIKTFAELVLEHFPRIDLLVNNGMYMLLCITVLPGGPAEMWLFGKECKLKH
jgi:NAD(P)-dependent dehydrogenase (short-subunit alcohol dehydrogenase family)